MLQERNIILPYRELVISAKRLLSPHLGLIVLPEPGKDLLDKIASDVVEFLIQYRVMRRHIWRKAEDTDTYAAKSALHRHDSLADAIPNTLILLEPLIESVDNMLNAVMPFRTMMVYTVERAFSELMLINHGDYRILKFQAEHPEWKPSAEEPEEIVMSCNGGMNYPSI